MKKAAICVLVVTALFECLGLWQVEMLHEVCAPVLQASTSGDLIIPASSVFGMVKELSLSFGFANFAMDGAIVCSVLALFFVTFAWRDRKNGSAYVSEERDGNP